MPLSKLYFQIINLLVASIFYEMQLVIDCAQFYSRSENSLWVLWKFGFQLVVPVVLGWVSDLLLVFLTKINISKLRLFQYVVCSISKFREAIWNELKILSIDYRIFGTRLFQDCWNSGLPNDMASDETPLARKKLGDFLRERDQKIRGESYSLSLRLTAIARCSPTSPQYLLLPLPSSHPLLYRVFKLNVSWSWGGAKIQILECCTLVLSLN